jgi:hypothetical protein
MKIQYCVLISLVVMKQSAKLQVAVLCVVLQLCSWEALDSVLGLEAGYPD